MSEQRQKTYQITGQQILTWLSWDNDAGRGVILLLLLWYVYTNVREKVWRAQQQGKEGLGIVTYSLLDMLEPHLQSTRRPISPTVTSFVVSLLHLCWSEAEGVVLQWAEAVGSVSIGAVPVRLSEPVLRSQPSVQDLGVSTRHGQAEETGENVGFFSPWQCTNPNTCVRITIWYQCMSVIRYLM